MNDTQKKMLTYTVDLVSSFCYYDRKEDEDLTIQDVEENLTEKVIDKMTEVFKTELLKKVR